MVDILKRFLIIIGAIIIGTLSIPMIFADDNQITIEQEGDDFELDITQIGYNNIIKQWTASEGIDGDDNVIIIKQANDRSAQEIRIF